MSFSFICKIAFSISLNVHNAIFSSGQKDINQNDFCNRFG